MRLINNCEDEFKDCVAYLEFNATDTSDGFVFTLVRARARPLVAGRRPTLIPRADWTLPTGDPRRCIYTVVDGPETEDISSISNQGDGTRVIILPSLGLGTNIPIWIQFSLEGNLSFSGDNATPDWNPLTRGGAPAEPNFLSYYIWTDNPDPVVNDRVYLRYATFCDSHDGHFDLATTSNKPHLVGGGSTIHNPPPALGGPPGRPERDAPRGG